MESGARLYRNARTVLRAVMPEGVPFDGKSSHEGIVTRERSAYSSDGGKTFGPRQTLSTKAGVDGVTVTAEGRNVLAFWHVMEG